MNEFQSLTNKQLSELFYRSRIAVNSITKSMPINDARYLRQRHAQLSSEILRRGVGFLL